MEAVPLAEVLEFHWVTVASTVVQKNTVLRIYEL